MAPLLERVGRSSSDCAEAFAGVAIFRRHDHRAKANPIKQAGYSGTTLSKKLGFRSGALAKLIAAPDDYRIWMCDLPDGVRFSDSAASGGADIVHLVVRMRSDLNTRLPKARAAMKVDGALWVSWPKKASGILTDVTEDVVRTGALAMDLVDVKVCAITEVWSGLKLVVRKSMR